MPNRRRGKTLISQVIDSLRHGVAEALTELAQLGGKPGISPNVAVHRLCILGVEYALTASSVRQRRVCSSNVR